jgi:dipeptidase E
MKGEAYLAWPREFLAGFLQGVDEVLFIPYAGVTVSYDDYTGSVQSAFNELQIKVTGVHQVGNMSSAIANAQSIIIGGGNTFSLLSEIQRHELLFDLRDAVRGGIPFVGWSAGSNMACPSIKTTNDMPIEEPNNFNALNLIDFQINPHYTEATIPNHGGESRDMRLQEFLIRNQHTPVIGLPEGMLLEVNDQQVVLKGNGQAKLFKYGNPAEVLKPGEIKIN